MVTAPVRRLAILLSVLLASPVLFAGENVWTTNGPAGNVTALAIAPDTAAVFAGVFLNDRSQAYRRLDEGSTWTLIAEAPPHDSVSAIAVSPVRSMTVFATTVREAYLGPGGNVYQSLDSGTTWTLRSSIDGPIVRQLVADPMEPQTLYAAASYCRCFQAPCFPYQSCGTNVLKSRDSGATWTYNEVGLPGQLFASVAVDPSDSRRIYAGGETGVSVSIDRGDHWTPGTNGLESCPSVLALAVNANGTVFAGTGQIFSHRFSCGGVYESADGGSTWSTTGFAPHYVNALVIDPSNPQTLYAGTARIGFFSPDGGVFRSTDGGAAWAAFGAGLNGRSVLQLVIDSSGRKLHATTSDGVFDYEIVPGARPPVVPPRTRTTRTLPARP
jgi:photosystem II stability/assembly factor-like uncharacterized protein